VGRCFRLSVRVRAADIGSDRAMALQQQTQTLQQQIDANKAQIGQLQGAIKYTVNSDLLFPSGGWQMSARGQQIIA
jgi:4-hydroxy-3-methylbut-2-en-1-yl diphosphate synthase IspG/GcpE